MELNLIVLKPIIQGSSPSARSTLVGASVTSQSPSKKSKTFTTNKSDTPPPNARTPATSNTRESHTSGTNAGGASTGMPALSAQTQLASLRGALEAARLREEKHKAEIEKLTKETEMLKWESANGRREVAEVRFVSFQSLYPTQFPCSCRRMFGN